MTLRVQSYPDAPAEGFTAEGRGWPRRGKGWSVLMCEELTGRIRGGLSRTGPDADPGAEPTPYLYDTARFGDAVQGGNGRAHASSEFFSGLLVVSAKQPVTYRREIVVAGKATRRWHIRRYVEERQRSQRRRAPAIRYRMFGGYH